MEQSIVKYCVGTPFYIECFTIENHPGEWNSTKIAIFRDEILIGEYIRNYANYATTTFSPFSIGEDWYALYSADYTATRVMKLHKDSIEDWCGEERSSVGFCPVEIYVPRYRMVKGSFESDGKTHEFETYAVDCDYKTEGEFLKDMPEFDFEHHTDFGFLCGCVWGDDTSWKLLYIDLSKVPNKELSITDKFGYWQLPNKLKLKECINMSNWEPDHNWIELTRMEHINLTTGERC